MAGAVAEGEGVGEGAEVTAEDRGHVVPPDLDPGEVEGQGAVGVSVLRVPGRDRDQCRRLVRIERMASERFGVRNLKVLRRVRLLGILHRVPCRGRTTCTIMVTMVTDTTTMDVGTP